MPDFVLAGGRDVPPLLFVMSENANHQIHDDTDVYLEQLLTAPHRLILLTDTTDPLVAAEELRQGASRIPDLDAFKGVVLIGGYDFIPPKAVPIPCKDPGLVSFDGDRL